MRRLQTRPHDRSRRKKKRLRHLLSAGGVFFVFGCLSTTLDKITTSPAHNGSTRGKNVGVAPRFLGRPGSQLKKGGIAAALWDNKLTGRD
jgi:hypothetical protein